MILGIDFMQIFLHLFNIILLFGGLYILLYKPVKDFIQKREEHYREMDEQAKKTLDEAKALKAEYTAAMDKADEEVEAKMSAAQVEIAEMRKTEEESLKKKAESVIAEAKAEGERKKKGIVEGAKEDISKMIEEATRKIMLDSEGGSSFDSFLNEAEKSTDGGNSDGRK